MKLNLKNRLERVLQSDKKTVCGRRNRRANALRKMAQAAAMILGIGGFVGTIAPVWADVQEIPTGETVQISGSADGTVFDGYYGAGTLEITGGKVVYTNDSETWGSVSANNGTIYTNDAKHPIYKWISTAKLNINNGATLYLDKNSLGQSQDITVNIASGGTMQIDTDFVGNNEMYEATVLSTQADGEMTLNGGGTFLVSGTGRVCATRGNIVLTIAMDSGAEIRIKDTAIFGNGGYTQQDWSNNKADLYIESGAKFDKWDSTANVIVGGLNGSGTILNVAGTFTVGAANRDGSFSGRFDKAGQVFVKIGTGTQTLDTNANFGATTIEAGTLAVTAGHSLSVSNFTIGSATSAAGTLSLAEGATFKMTGTLTNYGTFSMTSDLGSTFTGGINNYGELAVSGLNYPTNTNGINNYAGGTISIGTDGVVWAGSIVNANNNTDNSKTATITVAGGGLSIQGGYTQNAGAETYITGDVYVKGNLNNSQTYTSTVFEVSDGSVTTDGILYSKGEFTVSNGNVTAYNEVYNYAGGVFSVSGNLESLNSYVQTYGQMSAGGNLTAFANLYNRADSTLTVGNDARTGGEFLTWGGSTTEIGRDLYVTVSQLVVNTDNAAKATSFSVGRNLTVQTNFNVKQMTDLDVGGWAKIGTSLNLEQPTATATFGKAVTAGTWVSNSGTLIVKSGGVTAGTSIGTGTNSTTTITGNATAGTSIGTGTNSTTTITGNATAGTSIGTGTNSTTTITGNATAETSVSFGTGSTVNISGDVLANSGNLSISWGSNVQIGGNAYTSAQFWASESGEVGSTIDIGGDFTVTREGYIYRGTQMSVHGDMTALSYFSVNQNNTAPTGSVAFQQSLAVDGNLTVNGTLDIKRNSQLTVGGDLTGTGTLNNYWNSRTDVAGAINLAVVNNLNSSTFGGTMTVGKGITTTVGGVVNNGYAMLTIAEGGINAATQVYNGTGATLTVSAGGVTSGTNITNEANGKLTIVGDMSAGTSFENKGGGVVTISGNATGGTSLVLSDSGTMGARTTIGGDATFGGAIVVSWRSNPVTTTDGGLYVTGNLTGTAFTSNSNNVASGYVGGYTSVGKSMTLTAGELNVYGASTLTIGENLTTELRIYNGPDSLLTVGGNAVSGLYFQNDSDGTNVNVTKAYGADITGTLTTETYFTTGKLSKTHVGGDVTTGTIFGNLGYQSTTVLDANLNVGTYLDIQNYSLTGGVNYGATNLTIEDDVDVQRFWRINNDQQNSGTTKTGTVIINVGGDITVSDEYMENRMDTQLTVGGNVSVGSYLANRFNHSVGPTMSVGGNLTTGTQWEQLGGTATIEGIANIGTIFSNSQSGTNGAITTVKKTLTTGAQIVNDTNATLNVGANLASASDTAIEAGTYLENRNQLNISKGVVRTGTYINNSQAGSKITGTNATLDSGSYISNKGSIELTNGGLTANTYLTNDGTIAVSGTAASGEDFTVKTALTNNASKTITYSNAAGTFQTGALSNAGTLNVTAATLRLTGGITNNTGTLSGTIGALDVSGSADFGSTMAANLTFSGTPTLYVGGNGTVGTATIAGSSFALTSGNVYLDVLDATGHADYLNVASSATGVTNPAITVNFNSDADYTAGVGVIALYSSGNGNAFTYSSTTTPQNWSLTTRTETSGEYLYAVRNGVDISSLTIWVPGKSGNWNTAANWMNGTAPTAENSGYVLGGSNSFNNELTNASVYISGGNNIAGVNNLIGTGGVANFTGGTISRNDWMRIVGTIEASVGENGYYEITSAAKAGRLIVDGGTLDVRGLAMGYGANQYGILELKSGNVSIGGNGILIGDGGGGIGSEIHISGGSLYSSGIISVAPNTQHNSKLIITGGTVETSNNLTVGSGTSSLAQVDISNAPLTVGGAITFGNALGARVNSTINNATINVSGGFTFAQNGSTFNGSITGSTINGSNTIIVGNGTNSGTNSSATLSIADSTINVNMWGGESLYVGINSGTGALTLDNVALNFSGRISVGGNGGNGTITATNMPNASATALFIGSAGSSDSATSHGNGTVDWTGGDLTLSDVLYVGARSGQGTFNFSGGMITTSSLVVGHNYNAATAAEGPGIFTMTKGSLRTGGDISIGTNYGTGTFKFLDTAGTLTTSSSLNVGANGDGTFVFRGASMNVAGNFYAGNGDGGKAVIDYDGGPLSIAGNLYVGSKPAANATVSMNNTTVTVNSGFAVGNEGGTGTLNFKNSTFTNTTSNEIHVGLSGKKNGDDFIRSDGTMTLDNSDFNYASSLFVGRNSGTGTLEMTNGSTVSVKEARIGYMNTTTFLADSISNGVLTMDDSTLNCTYLGVGYYNLSVGEATITGGSVINNTGSLYLGYDYTINAATKASGTITMTDSSYSGTSAIVGEGCNGVGAITATGSAIELSGSLHAGWGGGAGTITFNDSSLVHVPSGNNTTTGTTFIGDSAITSNVLYSGSGTLTIDNSNTYDGTTIHFDARKSDNYYAGRFSAMGTININKSNAAFSNLLLGREGNEKTYSTYDNYSGGKGYLNVTDSVFTARLLGLGDDYNNYGEAKFERSDVEITGNVNVGTGTKAVTLNASFAALKNYQNSYGNLAITDSTFSSTGTISVGDGATGRGEITISGSTINATSISLGYNAGQATGSMSGSTLTLTSDLNIGRVYNSTTDARGIGSMTITNSDLDIYYLYVGREGGEGTLTMTNSGTQTLTTKGFYVGSSSNTDNISKYGSQGTATISGTIISNTGNLGMGTTYSSNGSLTIDNSVYTGTGEVNVGQNTINTDLNVLTVTDSTFTNASSFHVGRGELGVGSKLAGEYVVTKDSQAVGHATFTDSTANLTNVYLGHGGGKGELTVNGASNVSMTGSMFVGTGYDQTVRSDQGTLNVGGTAKLNVDGNLYVGYGKGLLYEGEDYLAIVNFADNSETTIANNMNLGRSSKFQVNQSGNAVVNVQTAGNTGTNESNGTGGTGSEYNLSGGTLNVLNTNASSWFYVGLNNNRAMNFNQTGGTANFARLNIDNTASVYNLSGGELNVGAMTSRGTVNVSGTGTFNIDALVNPSTSTINVSGGLLNARTLDTRAGTFTYTDGGLAISESFIAAAAGGTFTQNGAGTVFYVGGKDQAGQTAIGSSTVGNSYALTNGTAAFDIAYDGTAVQADYLKVWGGITLTADSTIEVNFTNTSGGELTGDNFWVIAEGTSLTGGDLFKKTLNDPKLGVTTMSSTGGGIVLVSYGNLDVDSMKIWKLDHTGTQADADSWNANADASLGYVIGGTNTIGDSVGVGKTLNVKGGTNTFSASLSDGTLLIEGGTNTFTESISGGAVTISGGDNTLYRTTNVHLGAVTEATVTLNGGTLTIGKNNNTIGTNGKIVVNGGNLVRTGNIDIRGNYAADGADAGAILEVNGGAVACTTIALGYAPTGAGNLLTQKGTLTLNNGSVNLTGLLELGSSANCFGFGTVNGGTLKVAGTLKVGVGQNSTGTYTQTDGTVTVGYLYVGADNTGITGSATISGGSFTAGTVNIGTKSGVTANVNLTGGTVKFAGVTTVGIADATAANLNVTGASLELTNQLKGTGSVSVSDGGSIFFNIANATVAYGDFESFSIAGMGGTWTDGASDTGALWFKNNTTFAPNLTLTDAAGIRVDGAKTEVTLAGMLTGNHLLTKLGDGKLIVTQAANTPSLDVQAGTVDLQVTQMGTLTVENSSNVLISSEMTIDVVEAMDSVLSFNVDNLNQVNWVTAAETVNFMPGALIDIAFDDDKDFRAFANKTMNLVEGKAANTEFLFDNVAMTNGQDLASLLSSEMQERFELYYAIDPTTKIGSVVLYGKEIPEPATIVLLILGACGLAVLRRGKNRNDNRK